MPSVIGAVLVLGSVVLAVNLLARVKLDVFSCDLDRYRESTRQLYRHRYTQAGYEGQDARTALFSEQSADGKYHQGQRLVPDQ